MNPVSTGATNTALAPTEEKKEDLASFWGPQGGIAKAVRSLVTVFNMVDSSNADTMAADLANFPSVIAFFLQRWTGLDPKKEVSGWKKDGSLGLVILGRATQELIGKWERGSRWVKGIGVAEQVAAKTDVNDPVWDALLREGHGGAAGAAGKGGNVGFIQGAAAWLQRGITGNYTFAFTDSHRLLGEFLCFGLFGAQAVCLWKGPKDIQPYFHLTPEQMSELREWMGQKVREGGTVLGKKMDLKTYGSISKSSPYNRARAFVEMMKEKGTLQEPQAEALFRGVTKKERVSWLGFGLEVLAATVQRAASGGPIRDVLNADHRDHFPSIKKKMEELKEKAAGLLDVGSGLVGATAGAAAL